MKKERGKESPLPYVKCPRDRTRKPIRETQPILLPRAPFQGSCPNFSYVRLSQEGEDGLCVHIISHQLSDGSVARPRFRFLDVVSETPPTPQGMSLLLSLLFPGISFA